ncbi:hypothetical protein K470DRAFT_80786 [Piedraia hortae CBS 480.64]|uniref:Uncharacterized protein n=1 Tax=Piedraia hortae CBS 480.64 TaxID=1314780 RepID=A0A6A7C857_9PEZI|nr:hypothetical protein K470DRAFT_80786 [Piedraia hortae CBS 480.64]
MCMKIHRSKARRQKKATRSPQNGCTCAIIYCQPILALGAGTLPWSGKSLGRDPTATILTWVRIEYSHLYEDHAHWTGRGSARALLPFRVQITRGVGAGRLQSLVSTDLFLKRPKVDAPLTPSYPDTPDRPQLPANHPTAIKNGRPWSGRFANATCTGGTADGPRPSVYQFRHILKGFDRPSCWIKQTGGCRSAASTLVQP